MITLIFCVFWCYLHCFQQLIYINQNLLRKIFIAFVINVHKLFYSAFVTLLNALKLLRSWIRRFTMIISACGFEQAAKLKGEESNVNRKA